MADHKSKSLTKKDLEAKIIELEEKLSYLSSKLETKPTTTQKPSLQKPHETLPKGTKPTTTQKPSLQKPHETLPKGTKPTTAQKPSLQKPHETLPKGTKPTRNHLYRNHMKLYQKVLTISTETT